MDRPEELFRRTFDVSRETIELLSDYEGRLLRWQKVKNLVAPSTLSSTWLRHFTDSAQLLRFAPNAATWTDLGAGAGFPGMVIAILLRDTLGASVVLIDSDHRKCAFLREVARATGAPVVVVNDRIENVIDDLPRTDVVTARALTGMPQLLELALPLFKKGAIGLFSKGQDVDAELTEASIFSKCDLELLPSLTQRDARIVRVRLRGSDSGS
jgi:16S rRNA (guanine527-N7)-methyltransferase